MTIDAGVPVRMAESGRLRNVGKIGSAGGVITLDIVPGSTIRRSVVGGHVVIDILDAALPVASPVAASATGPTQAAGRVQRPASEAAPHRPMNRSADRDHGELPGERDIRPADVQSPNTQALEPATPIVVAHDGMGNGPADGAVRSVHTEADKGPVAMAVTPPDRTLVAHSPPTAVEDVAQLSATLQPVPEAGPGHRVTLPFAAQTGAAAYRRGDEAVVVFDERRPLDLHLLQNDPVFAAASIQLLPTATILRMPLSRPTELRLQHNGNAWVITSIGGDATPEALRPLLPQMRDREVSIAATQPGMVLSVPDTTTGGVLTVGTQRAGGEGMLSLRQAPDFALLPTFQGVVMEAVSDTVALRAVAGGFAVAALGGQAVLASSAPDPGLKAAVAAARMSRIFDLPDLATGALVRRMNGAVAAAAATPIQSRAEARRKVAEAMVALGMGAEAQAVLDLAAVGDARVDTDPAAKALAAVAGLLAGRFENARDLADPLLDGTDEIAFWRAVALATQQEGAPAAAQVFANTLPLLLSYPMALRDRLAPLVAETMAAGGQAAAAESLAETLKENTSLELARAMLLQAKGGDSAPALTAYDRLAHSPDRLIRLRATLRGAELRLAGGQATPAQTAEGLGKMLFAWRGDGREVDLRLRVAALLDQSAQWRPALQSLRETEKEFPERGAVARAQMTSTFGHALSALSQQKLTPFDSVTLAEENADLMPDGQAGQQMAEYLCDQLLALDLPGRAIPFLESMITKSPPGVARAAFGGRLAALRLQQSNAAGAIDALKQTVSASLPPGLLESRTIVFARGAALLGDLASAQAALRELDTGAGDLAEADLAEAAKAWPDAIAALQRYTARALPQAGLLDEAQARVVLRLAGAASQQGEQAVLAQVRTRDLARLPDGPTADLVRLLVAEPVRVAADLARGAKESALARSVPAALRPIAAR